MSCILTVLSSSASRSWTPRLFSGATLETGLHGEVVHDDVLCHVALRYTYNGCWVVAAVEGCLAEGAAHGRHVQDGPRCRRRTQTGTGSGIRVKEMGAVVPGWYRKFHGEKNARESAAIYKREKRVFSFWLVLVSESSNMIIWLIWFPFSRSRKNLN
jgi:hypothetical protein